MNTSIGQTTVSPSTHPAATPKKSEAGETGSFEGLINAGNDSVREQTGFPAKARAVLSSEKSEATEHTPDPSTDSEVSMEAVPSAGPQDYAVHAGATGDRLPLLISLREIERAAASGEQGFIEGTGVQDGIGTTQTPLPDQPERRVSLTRTDIRPERAALMMDGSANSQSDSTSTTREKPVKELSASLPDRPGEEMLPEKRPERVTVMSLQTFTAPVSVNVNPTIAALVEVLASEEGVRQAQSLQSAASFSTPKPSGPAQSLRIELHPAELGMISARLHLSENQLMIEITPDTHEGWQRLLSDSESITRAMRDLGFDIGKVTVLQPSATATPAGRPAEMNMPDRQVSDFQSGQSGHDSSRGERHASGNNADRHEKTSTPAASSRGGTAGDLYI